MWSRRPNACAASAVDNSATASVSSFQTIAVLVLFIAVMAVLPWLLRRWQQRQMVARGGQGVQTQVLSTVALSPGQRIVVVEVGQGGHSTPCPPRADATVEQLLAMKPGDFIELDREPRIKASIGGVPVFDCQYGTYNNKYAIRVEQCLRGVDANWTGDKNGN